MTRRPARRKGGAAPLVEAAARLRDAVAPLAARAPLGAASYVLNPLDYAWDVHRTYLERYARQGVEAVLLGMNPGPWGMAQTGVPFGSPDLVQEFLGLSGEVRAPARTHPKRPIQGFAGGRTEVSGQRLWGGVRACFGTPEAFFARFFVLNFCPLVFQSEGGANLTPDKLPAALMADCFAACDAHLTDALRWLGPRTLIGVGKWATDRGRAAVEAAGLALEVATVLHPSPASPQANRGWLAAARGQLEALGHPWPAPREG